MLVSLQVRLWVGSRASLTSETFSCCMLVGLTVILMVLCGTV